MSGVFRAIGTVASVAAIIPGPHQPIAVAVAVVAGTLASVTAKAPAQQGSVIGYTTGANQKLPYLIGEAYTEGVEIYRVGYGGEVNDVKNPYAFIPRVLSCCGPIESMGTTYVNFESTSFTGSLGTVQEASGYYNEYLYHDQQLGARPESDALQSPSGWGTPTNWSTSHKLSGFAAVGWSLIWSKKGKRFGGGQIPPLGKVPQGVKVYDPRLDSTYPGGSGSHRIDDESTWEYSANPALHAIAYAYGRKMNGEPIFGVRLFDESTIDMAAFVAWANVCDANTWEAHGTIFEPDDKWNNLKKICEAGGAQPVAGSTLGVDYQAPRTSLATVTLEDLAGPVSASLGRGWKNRQNVIVPRYRSAAHQWGYVQADRVEVSAFITADGEEKIEERQWDLVKDKDQVTELATYDLYQRREAGPIELPCKPHMRVYRPGHCLTLAAEVGAHPDGEVKVVVRRRTVDAATGLVTLTCELETDSKHTASLGLTGVAPPTVTWLTQEEIDDAIFNNSLPAGYVSTLIRSAAIKNPRDASDVARSLIIASEASSVVTISVAKIDVDYPGENSDVTFAVEDITTLDDGTTPIGFETLYYPYFDYDPLDPDTPPTYGLSTTYVQAQNSSSNPTRHALGYVTTPADGSGGSSGGTDGGGGYGYPPDTEVP